MSTITAWVLNMKFLAAQSAMAFRLAREGLSPGRDGGRDGGREQEWVYVRGCRSEHTKELGVR